MIEEIKKSISDRERKYRGRFYDIGMIYDIKDLETSCPLMQYTGLKDKNGNPIYEGDIVKRRQKDGGIIEADNNEYICFIDWFMNGWACRKNRDHCGFTFGGEHIEVIGNIFENPELIQ